MTQNSYNVSDINKRTLNIQHNLSLIKPLIRKTRYLAFNSKFTVDNLHMRGGSFSALVKELNTIVTDLESILNEVSHSAWEMAKSASKCQQMENQIAFYNRALFYTSQNKSTSISMLAYDLMKSKDWLKESPAEKQYQNSLFQKNTPEFTIWNVILSTRSEMIEEFERLFQYYRKLAKLVDKINWVAVQQINLIAITALVEASWTGFAKSNIPVLSNNIRAMARQITLVETNAINQLVDLHANLQPLETPIRSYNFQKRISA
ncbi:MAG: hypothetical protein OEW12_01390 [Deltaproteobacteria bacterium]|nr:hypothetical protein [Deltaproteobacteria bacterium]